MSRLKSVFFSFDTDHNTTTTIPYTSIAKDWNTFLHPMAGTYDSKREIEYQLQVGSKRFPEYPCRTLGQAY